MSSFPWQWAGARQLPGLLIWALGPRGIAHADTKRISSVCMPVCAPDGAIWGQSIGPLSPMGWGWGSSNPFPEYTHTHTYTHIHTHPQLHASPSSPHPGSAQWPKAHTLSSPKAFIMLWIRGREVDLADSSPWKPIRPVWLPGSGSAALVLTVMSWGEADSSPVRSAAKHKAWVPLCEGAGLVLHGGKRGGWGRGAKGLPCPRRWSALC